MSMFLYLILVIFLLNVIVFYIKTCLIYICIMGNVNLFYNIIILLNYYYFEVLQCFYSSNIP